MVHCGRQDCVGRKLVQLPKRSIDTRLGALDQPEVSHNRVCDFQSWVEIHVGDRFSHPYRAECFDVGQPDDVR
jgi:hypothetical protein